MGHVAGKALAPLPVVLLAVACGGRTGSNALPAPSGSLDIGVSECPLAENPARVVSPCADWDWVRYDLRVFRRLDDGDPLEVVWGAAALNTLLLTLRVRDATPSESNPSIVATAKGHLVGDTQHFEWTRESDGPDAWLLTPRFVPLLLDLCCVMCREALIAASVEADDDRLLQGSVRVLLVRGVRGCPDQKVCCESADHCPDPAMATVCAPPPGG